jgi:FMN reductase
MIPNSTKSPLIVGLGGSTRPGSATERAVRLALDAAEEQGAEIVMFDGAFLSELPIYRPESATRTSGQRMLIDAVVRCEGIIVGSPGYHGSVSGLIKNALDTLEELSRATPIYLDGRAFGCIATAYGWQACGTTLVTLRTIGHALRAWPTPIGVGLNAATPLFDDRGKCVDEKAATQLKLLAAQTVSFARNTASLSDIERDAL